MVSTPATYSGCPGSNLGPEMGYHESLSGFSQSLQANAGVVSQIRPRPLLSAPFPIHYSLIFLAFDTATRSLTCDQSRLTFHKQISIYYGLAQRTWPPLLKVAAHQLQLGTDRIVRVCRKRFQITQFPRYLL